MLVQISVYINFYQFGFIIIYFFIVNKYFKSHLPHKFDIIIIKCAGKKIFTNFRVCYTFNKTHGICLIKVGTLYEVIISRNSVYT